MLHLTKPSWPLKIAFVGSIATPFKGRSLGEWFISMKYGMA
jgi:hypothetical protein